MAALNRLVTPCHRYHLAADIVRPIHAKAMPVLLTTTETCHAWLTGSVEEVIAMQCPLPPEQLRIVATGARKDEPNMEPETAMVVAG